jgi:hypothetical protein
VSKIFGLARLKGIFPTLPLKIRKNICECALEKKKKKEAEK